jgi:hypothetical protein
MSKNGTNFSLDFPFKVNQRNILKFLFLYHRRYFYIAYRMRMRIRNTGTGYLLFHVFPPFVIRAEGPAAVRSTRARPQQQYNMPVEYDPFDAINFWDSD